MRKALEVGESRRLLREHELAALLGEVTGLLNGRPLTYLSDDPQDGWLTPNHFLRPGDQDPNPPTPPGADLATQYKKSYERVQALTNIFWEEWTRNYLPTLQTRAKWQAAARDTRVNDLVLICDLGLPRNCWRVGRVVEVFPGKNNRVRAARIRTIHPRKIDFAGNMTGLKPDLVVRPQDVTEVVRAVTKLCLLRGAELEPNLSHPSPAGAVPEEVDTS
jgi:hypothetical protein